jgi:hypothetical protein
MKIKTDKGIAQVAIDIPLTVPHKYDRRGVRVIKLHISLLCQEATCFQHHTFSELNK